MRIKAISIIVTFIFSGGTAQAGFWDVISTPYNYVADLFSGDDTEALTGEPVVTENDASLDFSADTDLSIPDYSLDLSFSNTFTPSFASDPYGFGTGQLSFSLDTPQLSYAPSIYSPTWSSPNLAYGLGPNNYGLDSGGSSCSAFDYSLCVFCFNLGFSELDEVYENQCKELYTEVPDERTDEEIDGYCACNENKNAEMFEDGSVKEFIAKAVEKKKIETAGEVIANFKKVARSVGQPKAHPFFKQEYEGENARPESECSADNFGKIIKELTTADANGKAACKQDSIDELFEMAARQSDLCKENRGGKLNSENREHCKTYGGFDNLTQELAGAEVFDDRVAAFQDIFAGGLQDRLDMVKSSLFERDNLGILLRGFGPINRTRRTESSPREDYLAQIRMLSHDRFRRGSALMPGVDNGGSNEGEGSYANAHIPGVETVEETHDRDMTQALIEDPEAFLKTFHPENYAVAMKDLLQVPNGCQAGDCFEHMRILATEPYVIGPMMRMAKRETPLSPEMERLMSKVRSSGGNSTLNDLAPDEMRIIENHSREILKTFKNQAMGMLRQQHAQELPRNLATLRKALEKNKRDLRSAQTSGNPEKERKIQEEINRQEDIQKELLTMQGLFQKLVNNPQSISLEEMKGALIAIWEVQSSQLSMACDAVKTQAEAYCRLKETEDSNMYSAVDLLGLDFNKNKDIANDLENKSGSDKVENSQYLAILDAMTCIEEGRYTKYPENTNNPVFVTLNGSIEQCDQRMNEFDSFPGFLSGQEGVGKYTAVLAPRESWEKWTRCGGTKMRNTAPNNFNLPLIPDRQSSLATVYDQTLGDVVNNYKNSSTYEGGNSTTSNQLDKFKDQYGDIGASAIYGGGDFGSRGGGLAGKSENIEPLADVGTNSKINEVGMNGASREPASEDQNGATTIQNNGTVQYNPYQRMNGEVANSESLEQIENRIIQNNEQIVKAGQATSEIQKKIDAEGEGSASKEVLDQLEALRKQIEELRQSNEKLALERKLEIEKLKQEELQASIESANNKKSNNQNTVVEPSDTPVSRGGVTTTSSRKTVVNSGNGSNGVVGGAVVNSGAVSNVDSFQSNTANAVSGNSRSVRGKLSGKGRSGGLVLTGRTSSGEQFNISSSEILSFEGRSDITSFDSAVSIALQSDKNAFVFQGKVYVKKGDKFVEVKDIKEQERALASGEEVEDINDVTSLVERLKKEQEEEDEDDTVDNVPVIENEVKSEPQGDRDRKEVESLWDIIKQNVFNFGS